MLRKVGVFKSLAINWDSYQYKTKVAMRGAQFVHHWNSNNLTKKHVLPKLTKIVYVFGNIDANKLNNSNPRSYECKNVLILDITWITLPTTYFNCRYELTVSKTSLKSSTVSCLERKKLKLLCFLFYCFITALEEIGVFNSNNITSVFISL